MSSGSKYRSRSSAQSVIGLSVSYERANLLARGLGLEHLREMLLGVARPLLRSGASLAYGGHWRETEDNFTYDLLRLISAEQQDSSAGGPDAAPQIGRLFNHLAWPHYLAVTPRIEAQWINCCRIVRISQQQADIVPAEVAPDEQAGSATDRVILNCAITLSVMRRLATAGLSIPVPGLSSLETVPGVGARVLLGGKVRGFGGFLPGIFEEALIALQHSCPLYIFGGFGGAAEAIARALLAAPAARPQEFEAAWHEAESPSVLKLRKLAEAATLAAGVQTTTAGLDALYARLEAARPALPAALRTGLDESETRELMETRDMRRGVQLLRKGLVKTAGLKLLPA